METMEHPDQQILPLKEKRSQSDISRDTIGADPGAAVINETDLKEYVKIVGLPTAKHAVMAGLWRITEKGREYLQGL